MALLLQFVLGFRDAREGADAAPLRGHAAEHARPGLPKKALELDEHAAAWEAIRATNWRSMLVCSDKMDRVGFSTRSNIGRHSGFGILK